MLLDKVKRQEKKR